MKEVKTVARSSFQGMCLADMNGSKTIRRYDQLPKPVRERISLSPYNLCPVCIAEHSLDILESKQLFMESKQFFVEECFKTIVEFENHIRESENVVQHDD